MTGLTAPGVRRPLKLLVLAGSAEARRLCARLADAPEVDCLASLAGAVSDPTPYPCATRVGGFGGATGLARFLQKGAVDALIDATHPFATRISAHAARAAATVGIPAARLERAPWPPPPDAAWVDVASLRAAAEAVPAGAEAFLAVGPRSVAPFRSRRDVRWTVRAIEAPRAPGPETLWPEARWLFARPPFDPAEERALFQRLGITHLVAKNSGGAAGRAKLDAARDLGVTVVMTARPAQPDGLTVRSVSEACAWLEALAGRRPLFGVPEAH